MTALAALGSGLPLGLFPSAVRAGSIARASGRAAPPSGAGVFEVTRFGAVGDGRTMATAAIQRAIDACHAAGGGTVSVPPGRYLTGALFLRSGMRFHLSSGATLL